MNKLINSILLTVILYSFLCLCAWSEPYIIHPYNLGVDSEDNMFVVRLTTDKKVYQAGEKLKATITSNRDCYILVYYTNEQGNCLIIYPNRYKSNNRLSGGESMIIGNNPSEFSLTVGEEKVRDYLQVIATDYPIDTRSLEGIRDPGKFINKVRLILKERVEERKKEGEKDKNTEIKVFAVGTTDYLCNYPEYFSPGSGAVPQKPEIYQGDSPLIEVRRLIPPGEYGGMVGPDLLKSDSSSQRNLFEVSSSSGELHGTVSYKEGIKKILVNGQEPAYISIGDSKGIKIRQTDEKEVNKILDFKYTLEQLSATPSTIIIKAEGMDGKISTIEIKVKRKRK